MCGWWCIYTTRYVVLWELVRSRFPSSPPSTSTASIFFTFMSPFPIMFDTLVFTADLADAHISQSLDRCATVDDTLTRLARTYPHTKFLRARAGAIGFASSQNSTPNLATASTSLSYSRVPSLGVIPQRPSRIREKDEDEFFDEEEDEKASDGDEEDEEEDE